MAGRIGLKDTEWRWQEAKYSKYKASIVTCSLLQYSILNETERELIIGQVEGANRLH